MSRKVEEMNTRTVFQELPMVVSPQLFSHNGAGNHVLVVTTARSRPLAPGQTAAGNSSNGIEPAQTAEPQEIRVRSMQHGVMLKGEARQLGISHEISRRAKRLQKLEHLREVIGPGFKNLHDGLCLPRADVLRGFNDGHGIPKHAAIGADAHETDRDDLG